MQLRHSAVRGEAMMSRSVSPALRLRSSKIPVSAGVLRASLSALLIRTQGWAVKHAQGRAKAQVRVDTVPTGRASRRLQVHAAVCLASQHAQQLARCCALALAQEDAYAVHELGPSAVLPQGLCSSAKHAAVRIGNSLELAAPALHSAAPDEPLLLALKSYLP